MKTRVWIVLAATITACSRGGGSVDPGVSSFPQVTILSPTGAGPLEGVTTVAASASDDVAVTAVQFQLDGVNVGARLTQAPWRIRWDTSSASDGSHQLTALAWDADLNEGAAPAIALDVENLASDPTIDFATFLGGNDDDWVRDVFVDALGYVYVTGGTASPDLPTTAGAYDRTFNGTHDAFVACFEPDGGALVFATYLGGPNYDRAYAIEVDSQGYIYIGGRAGDGLPTTPGSLQPNFGGDDDPSALYGPQDGFVAKLAPDGSAVEWCTYFGTDGSNALRDIDIDASGNVYVAGATDRVHYAVTSGSFDTSFQGPTDGLVAEITADGSSLVWGAYFGGSGPDGGTPSVRVAADGTTWVLGHSQSDDFPTTPGAYQRARGGGVDLVVLRIAPGGAPLEWSTYFGGSSAEFTETHGLCVDDAGVVTIGATTESSGMPVVSSSIPPPFQSNYAGSGGSGTGQGTNYAGDGFVARLAADGKSLLAFTYFGGSVGEGVEGIAIDDQGRVFLSGGSYSSNLPMTADAVQKKKAAGADAFLARFSSDLSTLEFATFYGGSDDDVARSIAIDASGTTIGVGNTYSVDFPSTPTSFDPSFDGGTHDGFVFEVDR